MDDTFHFKDSESFVQVGKAAASVVIDLAARRQLLRALKGSVVLETQRRAERDKIQRQVDELLRAKGHIISAWKIYVAEHKTVEEARLKIGADLFDITAQPVIKQE